MAAEGAVQLITSDAILNEVARVLRGEKFGWTEEKLSRALVKLSRFTKRVEPTHTLDIVTADPSDNRILECADAGNVDYIVSGDKHLLRLRQHGAVPILKVADFVNQLEGTVGKGRQGFSR